MSSFPLGPSYHSTEFLRGFLKLAEESDEIHAMNVNPDLSVQELEHYFELYINQTNFLQWQEELTMQPGEVQYIFCHRCINGSEKPLSS